MTSQVLILVVMDDALALGIRITDGGDLDKS